MIVNDELKQMWKEVVTAYFKVLNGNFTGRNKRNRKKLN
jgi:hypothetical protein